MPDYPDSVYAPRTKENIAGISYDPAKTTTGFAEDISYLENEVLAIIDDLVGAGSANGLKGAAASFKANWLSQHNANGTHKDLTTNMMTVGASDYDRLEIADDGTSKGTLSKRGDDTLIGLTFNSYYDGSEHSYDPAKYSLLFFLRGTNSDAYASWHIAEPGESPAYTEMLRLTAAGTLETRAGGGYRIMTGATTIGGVTGTTQTVSTSPVALIAINLAGIFIISGVSGAANFHDLVFFKPGQTAIVIQAINVSSPAVRTYSTVSDYYLALAMASGTYTVRAMQMGPAI